MQGMCIDRDSLAADAYRETGPGETFLGTAHTLAHFENANYLSELADTRSYEEWNETGRLDVQQRAQRRWQQLLADYQAPPLDPAIDDALLDFMARRKSSMPDQWY